MLSALATALVHSIWQGCVVGAVVALVLTSLRDRPRVRHNVAMGGLSAQLVWFLVTLASELGAGVPAPVLSAGSRILLAAAPSPWAVWLVTGWALGVVVMAMRLGLAIRHSNRLRRDCTCLPDAVTSTLSDLARRMGLPNVRAALCEHVDGPQVVGVISPILLVPTATLVGLSSQQLRAVLAHELAHIARWDPITQAAQEAITMLFFHHPVTHWFARVARRSRENACDDVAAGLVGRKAIASALLELETYRTEAFALGASTELTSRIRRLVHPPATTQPRTAVALGVAALVLIVAGPAVAGDRAAEREFRQLERQTTDYLQLTLQTETPPPSGSYTEEQMQQLDQSLSEALDAKTSALSNIETAAIRVVAEDSPVWSTAAMTQLGTAYEDMAVAMMQSTIPPYLSEVQANAYRGTLQEQADVLYIKAETAYTRAAASTAAPDWATEAGLRLEALEQTRQVLAFDLPEVAPYDASVFDPLLATFAEQVPAFRDRCGESAAQTASIQLEQAEQASRESDDELLQYFQTSLPEWIAATSEQAACPAR